MIPSCMCHLQRYVAPFWTSWADVLEAPPTEVEGWNQWTTFDAMARSMSLLPVVLLALGAWMLSSLTSQSGFVMNTATPRGSKVAMRGFKDDFYAWKETLSSEDQALLLKQAQNVAWQNEVSGICNPGRCRELYSYIVII